MAYKISGTKNDTAKIYIINEATDVSETIVTISGAGAYEIKPLVAGRKLVVARKLDGESIAYGYVDPAFYIALPTVTTQAASSITGIDFIGNGNITDTGGENATRRGFCYMVGTSGDPTTANSVAYDDGNFPAGAYTKTVSGLSGLTGYRVRAYAVNSVGISYGATVQVTTLFVYVPGQRGVFGGGNTGAVYSNVLDYITIATAANAIDFGDLTVARHTLAACSSSIRGVFGGGVIVNVLDYITIATAANAIDFGYLTVARYYLAACSSSTRGVFGGGNPTTNVLDYITIATAANAIDFGDLTLARHALAACSSSTRGVFGGGETAANSNVLDYITIATAANAIDFGDLTLARYCLAACSSSTRGVFGGGYSPTTNVIDYITIATPGNASDFGDLTVARYGLAACSSPTRGVFGGGGAPHNVLDYITIATAANAIVFGDLTVARYYLAACSDGHGGL